MKITTVLEAMEYTRDDRFGIAVTDPLTKRRQKLQRHFWKYYWVFRDKIFPLMP